MVEIYIYICMYKSMGCNECVAFRAGAKWRGMASVVGSFSRAVVLCFDCCELGCNVWHDLICRQKVWHMRRGHDM
jgi:hypothetical protein